MSNKHAEINAALANLTKLNDELQSSEHFYAEALKHASEYSGYNEKIEQVRDDKAESAYHQVQSVKQKIAEQMQLIEDLISNQWVVPEPLHIHISKCDIYDAHNLKVGCAPLTHQHLINDALYC